MMVDTKSDSIEVIEEEDIITDGKYIIIRRTFEKSSYKLIKLGGDK